MHGKAPFFLAPTPTHTSLNAFFSGAIRRGTAPQALPNVAVVVLTVIFMLAPGPPMPL